MCVLLYGNVVELNCKTLPLQCVYWERNVDMVISVVHV